MYGHTCSKSSMDQPGKVANPARGQLNREKKKILSAFTPENLVSRDGFGSPVPRQPAHLHAQAESGAYLRDSSRVPRRRPFIHSKPPYAIGSVPSLSGHAIAYRWRSLPRVRRHKASKPQGSSERVLAWQVTMDQLICTSLSHTHHEYWYEVGMLKVAVCAFGSMPWCRSFLPRATLVGDLLSHRPSSVLQLLLLIYYCTSFTASSCVCIRYVSINELLIRRLAYFLGTFSPTEKRGMYLILDIRYTTSSTDRPLYCTLRLLGAAKLHTPKKGYTATNCVVFTSIITQADVKIQPVVARLKSTIRKENAQSTLPAKRK